MLLPQVKRTIDRYLLLEKGDWIIVGVSAGVDSMVLLHVLNTYRQEFDLSLIVAHVNHGLRPDETEKETELVQKESERLGIPFEYAQFNVKEFQKMEGLSPQDAARRIRFHFFNHLLQKHHAHKIALGHNADDQVETVLLRLIRGSGLKGLKGMLPIREGRVIRPLIEVWRSEVESFAKEMGIPYLLDSSNLKENYLRNRLRLTLIPLMEKEYQPNFKAVIKRTSVILREENDYLERMTEEAYQKIVLEGIDGISFKFSEFQSLHHAIQWRLIQKIVEKNDRGKMIGEEGEGLDANSIYKKLNQPSQSFLFNLSYGVFLEKRYDMIFLRKGKVNPIPPFEVELNFPGPHFIEAIGKKVVMREILRDDQFRDRDIDEFPNTALLDCQNLQFPLKIRNFRPGDRFQPLGTKGTQKLKKFFIDHKIPKFERPRIPLLITGEAIAWIIGYRIDERVKITKKTQRILRIAVV